MIIHESKEKEKKWKVILVMEIIMPQREILQFYFYNANLGTNITLEYSLCIIC